MRGEEYMTVRCVPQQAVTTGSSRAKLHRITVRPRDLAAPAIHARVCANSSSESFGSSLNRAMIMAPTMAAQLPIAARRFSVAVLPFALRDSRSICWRSPFVMAARASGVWRVASEPSAAVGHPPATFWDLALGGLVFGVRGQINFSWAFRDPWP